MLVSSILLMPVLAHIIYTDIKKYKVHLLTLSLGILVSLMRVFFYLPENLLFITLLLNIVFIATILIATYSYAVISKRNFSKIIGLGDLVFMGIVALNFAPVILIVFILISSLIGILYSIFIVKSESIAKQIPFAGLMAVILFVLIACDIFTGFSTFKDELLLRYFLR